jgi:hypothetical protein
MYSSMNSQTLQDMTVSASDGTWSEMTGGTNMGTGDDNIYGFYWPFDFKYNNVSYSANTSIFYFSFNGYMTFSSAGNYGAYYAGPMQYVWPSVQAMRNDLYTLGGNSAGVTGSAPNRVLILQWLGIDWYYSWSASMNFQIKFYETTNKIEIVYGPMNNGTGFGYYGPWVGFTASSTSYINVVPGSTFTYKFSKDAGSDGNSNINASTFGFLTTGKTISLTAFPSLVDVYPSAGTILRRGNIYTGSQHPAMLFSRIAGQADVYGKYRISGPLPADPVKNRDYKTIYTGTKSSPSDELIYFNPQPVGNPASAPIVNAKGIAAGTAGALDLSTNSDQIIGGEYMVEAEMQLPTFNYVQRLDPQVFVIALDYDLAITSLVSPKSKFDKRYPLSTQIPIQARVTNLGLTSYSEFTANAYMRDVNGDTIYRSTINWPPTPQSLTTGNTVTMNFTNFRPRDVGDFRLTIEVIPVTPMMDDEWKNNYYPRAADAEFVFTTAHEIEAEALDILVPGDSVYVGRPIIPKARFRNNGVSDISDVPATLFIVKLSTNDTVYRDNIIVQDIPSGKYNTNDVLFSSNFIAPSAGSYRACVSVNSIDDPIVSNNSFCKNFEVVNAMAGTYTIGTTTSGSRNFTTFIEALNACYLKGLTGPVVFELTDANYTTGDPILTNPAIDLSGRIIGVDSINTITFKPSQARSLYQGSISINMSSGAGIGIYVAQNLSPSNSWAAINTVTSGLKNKYSTSAGYITFDGGNQKSIKLILNTASTFNAAVYFGNGASNCAIKHCYIESATPSYSDLVPLTKFDAGNSQFAFEANSTTAGTISTGILMRSIAPQDKGQNSNQFRLDTLPNHHNVISGNVIHGFAYGVTTVGIGPLFLEGTSKYKRFYNKNNEISGNEIYNVSTAGIVIGHEESSSIKGNRIYSVTGSTGKATAGIIAGGQAARGFFGYNNIDLFINGNEISGITSAVSSTGINVEQDRNGYPFASPPFVYFPDVAENIKVINNTIWNLNSTTSAASKFGIHLSTERLTNANAWTQLITPKVTGYYSRNDEIINNTILVTPDNNGLSAAGPVAGIAVQHVQSTKIYNNAVSVIDPDIDPANPVNSGFMLQGTMPNAGSLTSDRNAFFSGQNVNASYYHFIELDKNGVIVDNGTKDQYSALSQWQNWTLQDKNSTTSNFTQDLTFLGTEPKQSLRVKSNPSPKGSVLNNRGERITSVKTDIDGNPRGAAGQRYDLGASEFNGDQYLSDMEALSITAPASYKSGSGLFADAEYIMTTAPVEVKALIRNNGNLNQSGVQIFLKIYRELSNGLMSTTPEISVTKTFNCQTTESIEVPFTLADGLAPDFTPKAYGDLRGLGYVIPDQFLTMEANVSPKYKIEIGLASDQFIPNNTMSKVVRFYVLKSNLRMIVSADNSYKTLSVTSTPDEIAGKLNYSNLTTALGTLGWKVNITNNQYDYDIFERSGWEQKAVNYNNYRTMFWSDANDKSLSRYQRTDISNLLSGGNQTEKKNLIISSQDMVRQHYTSGPTPDASFITNILRSAYKTPGNPKGSSVTNDGNQAVGISIGRNIAQDIKATTVTNDPAPYCGLVSIDPNGEGLATAAFYYKQHAGAPSDSIVGVTTSTLTRNVCYFAVDWRHWNNLTNIIRGSIDFIEKNGGTIIPVELVSFDAISKGKSVDLSWTTASEYNTNRFEIERAYKSEAGVSSFIKIAEEKATGYSSSEKIYGPISDKTVEFGNTYVYRLKMIDNSGEPSYSDNKEVKIGNSSENWIGLPVPNPAINDTKIEYNLAEASSITINIIDMNGRLVSNVYNGYSNAGLQDLKINTSELVNGTYTIILKVGDNQYINQIQVVK